MASRKTEEGAIKSVGHLFPIQTSSVPSRASWSRSLCNQTLTPAATVRQGPQRGLLRLSRNEVRYAGRQLEEEANEYRAMSDARFSDFLSGGEEFKLL